MCTLRVIVQEAGKAKCRAQEKTFYQEQSAGQQSEKKKRKKCETERDQQHSKEEKVERKQKHKNHTEEKNTKKGSKSVFLCVYEKANNNNSKNRGESTNGEWSFDGVPSEKSLTFQHTNTSGRRARSFNSGKQSVNI